MNDNILLVMKRLKQDILVIVYIKILNLIETHPVSK